VVAVASEEGVEPYADLVPAGEEVGGVEESADIGSRMDDAREPEAEDKGNRILKVLPVRRVVTRPDGCVALAPREE
jgi:hypothetical protein